MFEFRKYIQKKKDKLDPNLFEYAESRANALEERKKEQFEIFLFLIIRQNVRKNLHKNR